MAHYVILILALITISMTSIYMMILAPATWTIHCMAWLIIIFTKETQNDN